MELLNQVITKDKTIKTLNEKLEEKEILILKLEKKTKQSFKSQESTVDPLKYLNSLSENAKILFV